MSSVETLMSVLAQWSEPAAQEIEYRCYHDDQGRPLEYTTEHKSGSWIAVTLQEFSMASRRMRVRDGRLVAWRSEINQKLCPSIQGTACAPDYVAITVQEHEPHQRWQVKTYD